MVVDVQDYAVLLCRDVHQSAGQKDGRRGEERNLPVQIDAYGVSEFDMQFPQYQVVFPQEIHVENPV
jgi:PTS system cellobiose-specific IIB component